MDRQRRPLSTQAAPLPVERTQSLNSILELPSEADQGFESRLVNPASPIGTQYENLLCQQGSPLTGGGAAAAPIDYGSRNYRTARHSGSRLQSRRGSHSAHSSFSGHGLNSPTADSVTSSGRDSQSLYENAFDDPYGSETSDPISPAGPRQCVIDGCTETSTNQWFCAECAAKWDPNGQFSNAASGEHLRSPNEGLSSYGWGLGIGLSGADNFQTPTESIGGQFSITSGTSSYPAHISSSVQQPMTPPLGFQDINRVQGVQTMLPPLMTTQFDPSQILGFQLSTQSVEYSKASYIGSQPGTSSDTVNIVVGRPAGDVLIPSGRQNENQPPEGFYSQTRKSNRSTASDGKAVSSRNEKQPPPRPLAPKPNSGNKATGPRRAEKHEIPNPGYKNPRDFKYGKGHYALRRREGSCADCRKAHTACPPEHKGEPTAKDE